MSRRFIFFSIVKSVWPTARASVYHGTVPFRYVLVSAELLTSNDDSQGFNRSSVSFEQCRILLQR